MTERQAQIDVFSCFLVALLLSFNTQAQTLSNCRLIDSDADRLLCYDKIPSETSPSTRSPHETIASYSGAETHSTRPLITSGPWEIDWLFEKSGLILIHSGDGKILERYDISKGSSSGFSSWQDVGTFNLEIITAGRWQIKIKNSSN